MQEQILRVIILTLAVLLVGLGVALYTAGIVLK